jgi:arginine decarboxylase
VHVSITANGEYRLDRVVAGDTVTDVLQYVSYSREELLMRLRGTLERALKSKRITLEESRHLLKIYEAGLSSYTYLDTEKPSANAVKGLDINSIVFNGTAKTPVP